ncbi:MAG: hypothetical protein AAF747_04985 [Planctomycetota bacterium]
MKRRRATAAVLASCVAALACLSAAALQPAASVQPLLPPGLPAAVVEPVPDTDQARASLEDVIASLAAPERPAPPFVSDEDRRDALRLYTSGRTAVLNRDFETGRRDLEAAARLDPASGKIRLELAEALIGLGRRTSAITAMTAALDLGVKNARAAFFVGTRQQQFGRHDEACLRLAAAINIDSDDTALPWVAYAALGESLEQTGRLAAAAQAFRLAVEVHDNAAARTTLRGPLAALLAGRDDLRIRAGDIALRLSDGPQALADYAATDNNTTLARRVYAAVLADQPTTAVASLFAAIASDALAISEQHLAIARYLAANPTTAPAIRDASQAFATIATARSLPSGSERIALLLASSDPATAADHLIAHAAAFPSSRSVPTVLADVSTDPAAARDLIARLIAQQPDFADTFADVLIARHGWQAGAQLPPNPTDADRLLEAHSLATGHVTDAAWAAIASLDRDNPLQRLIVAVRLGRYEDATQALAEIPDNTPSKVRALATLQRFDEASELADRLAAATDAPLAIRLTAATLAEVGRDHESAVRWYRHALASDPGDARAWAGLLRAFDAQGPLADRDELSNVLAAITNTAPGSPMLTWRSIEESATRGLWAQALPKIQELIESPTQATRAVAEFASARIRLAAGDPLRLTSAIELLQARQTARPSEASTTAALASLLIAARQTDEALELLSTQADQLNNAALARQHEQLVEQLGQATRSAGLTNSRLINAPPTIDNLLELAASLARSNPITARPRVETALRAAAQLTPRQMQWLAEAAREAATTTLGPEPRRAAIAIADLATERDITLGWQTRFFVMSMRLGETPADDRALAPRFVDDVRRIATELDSLDDFAAFRDFVPTADPDALPQTLPEAQAEVAYALASSLYASGYTEIALPTYRVAFEFDPEHTLASNDLGYFLIERGESIEEAARLIEQAYANDPTNGNIIDSIGWLRYKQGRLRDNDADDRGAISFLSEAIRTIDGQDNPTVYDHLGDALYRDGREIAARQNWLRARSFLGRTLTNIREGFEDSPRVIQMRTKLANIDRKLIALDDGTPAPVAPIFAELNPELDPEPVDANAAPGE